VTDPVDYAVSVKLDLSSSRVHQEVTVKTFVDGDTTHFHVPTTICENGVLKARYLAVNTPESTGKIEEWGKKASKFTRSKLEEAESIYIESDDENWNVDSTGGRYLVWVWYKTKGASEYRNLNLELLQEGLAIASNSGQNSYGTQALAAIAQARALKKNIYSGEKDPDFFYGDAYEITLKELRANIQDYSGKKVAFEGVITLNSNNSVYVEEYDDETGVYFGMAVYYGFGLSGGGLEVLSVGNRARIVGTVQYYETGASWQVSGLTYREMKPDDPSNIKKISDGHTAAYQKITADQLINGQLTITTDDGSKSVRFADMAVGSTVSMEGLKVVSCYTTNDPESSNYGAISITVEQDGVKFVVRTAVLLDENGKTVSQDIFQGKTIDVKGFIDCYGGTYQVKVLNLSDITIH